MSAEPLPPELRRLLGQHPAALRTVRWQDEELGAGEYGHLEIETKHGHVVVIDQISGSVFANPPIPSAVPPGPANASHRRRVRDLTAELACAFDGRPVFQAITASRQGSRLTAWRFNLSTGRAFTFTLGSETPLTCMS